jgi:hypothetical protein
VPVENVWCHGRSVPWIVGMPSMRRALAALSVVATAGSVLGCVPSFGVANRVVVVAKGGGADRMGTPRDLQFHPLKRDELWVASASTDGRLSGNYIITKPGTAQQTTRFIICIMRSPELRLGSGCGGPEVITDAFARCLCLCVCLCPCLPDCCATVWLTITWITWRRLSSARMAARSSRARSL